MAEKVKMTELTLTPKIGVVVTSARERALGRMLTTRVVTPPDSDAKRDMLGEAFMSLYTSNPETYEQARPERAANKTIMDWVMGTPDFSAAKAPTTNNMIAAKAAAGVVYEGLVTDDALKDALDKQKEAEDAAKEQQEALKEMSEAAKNGDEQGAEQALQKADDAQKKAQAAAAAAQQSLEKLQKNPLAQGMVSSVLKKAAEKGSEIAKVMAGWGVDPGTTSLEDIDDVMALVDDKSDFARTLAELIGRLEGIASDTIASTRAGYTGTVTEPNMTKKIDKLFPTERLYLSQSAPPLIRFKKIHNLLAGGGLLGWQTRQDAEKKGAFVALVDESGSMSGDPIKAAKAVTLGVAKALEMDKAVVERKYEVFGFSSRGDRMNHVSSEDGWQDHVRWGKEFLGGGTDFDIAIKKAIDVIRKMKEENLSADFLFITDGVANASPKTLHEWEELKAESGARMITISIGTYHNDQVRKMSDTFIPIEDFDDLMESAEELVRRITSEVIKAEGGD